jgi:hypothetical protein
MEGAWAASFQGDGANLFRPALNQMNKDRGNKVFVPIIQSSGMRKSRLVDKTAKLIFTVPFCFRFELDGGCTPRRHLHYAKVSLQGTQRWI